MCSSCQHNDIQHSNIQYNTQHNTKNETSSIKILIITAIIIILNVVHTKCRVMGSVIMMNVIMLSVVAPLRSAIVTKTLRSLKKLTNERGALSAQNQQKML